MGIRRDNIASQYRTNRQFNAAVRNVVQNIFQQERPDPLSYRAARASLHHRQARPHSKEARRVDLADSLPNETTRFDTADLAPYEQMVFGCCAWGEYSTYVITGEMGSGKTTLARFLYSVLRRPRRSLCPHCSKCVATVIYRDFNTYAHTTSIPAIVDAFSEDLLAAFISVLTIVFTEDGRIDALRGYLESSPADLDQIGLFHKWLPATRRRDWLNLAIPVKVSSLMEFVQHRPGTRAERDVGTQLLYCVTLLKYVREHVRRDAACLVLIFDNLDGVRPDCQLELLRMVLALQATAKVKMLIPLRYTTFKHWEGHCAFVFGHIEHVGPRPMEIVQARLRWWSEHWYERLDVAALAPADREALRNRVDYLLELFESSPRTVDALAALAGGSVRLGLFLMERVFMNGLVRYDHNPYYAGDVVRCVLLDNEQDTLDMSLDDQLTTNLFADPLTNEFSMITLRLLQLSYTLADRPGERTVAAICRTIRALGAEAETVRLAMNQLLFEKSALLWVDAVAMFRTSEELFRSTDVVNVTEAGALYYEALLNDLVYVQECFMSVTWSDVRVPLSVDYRQMSGRFVALRACLACLLERDRDEVQRFLEAHRRNVVGIHIEPQLVSGRILYNVARGVVAILRARNETPTGDELSAWRDLLVTGFNMEWTLLGTTNERLRKLGDELKEMEERQSSSSAIAQ